MRISDWSSDVCSSDLFGQRQFPFNVIVQPVGVALHEPRLELLALCAHLKIDVVEAGWAVIIAVRFKLRHAPFPIGLAEIERTRSIRTFVRSEEHTSELQSLMRISYAVFCLKKKRNTNINNIK